MAVKESALLLLMFTIGILMNVWFTLAPLWRLSRAANP
jgi:hypothetical protein